ncbi:MULTISPECIES: SDR family NAD(P)-dependent oxidoreductase [Hydrogenophaga]|uniref:SDR family NAD(P)-dependent oxidoreductase n=2 Tax=Hydrogenophaga TaxID=47420 RepID=A0ABW2QQS9_9BURK
MATPPLASHALVTGAAAGIGLEIARQLAQAGHVVHLLDRNAAGVRTAELALRDAGFSAHGHTLDITDEDAVAALVGGLPALSVLVNNAGIFEVKPFFEVDAADFRRMYEVNTVAMFTLSRTVARRMPQGGRIVNLASRAMLGARHYPHYVASKAAVVGLTRAMALELAPQGITVNAVAPGVIETDMLKARSDTNLDGLRALQPLGRLGTPADIARTVVFLAAPEADFITGQTLLVDGGRSLGGATSI